MHNEHLVVSLKKPVEEVVPRPPVRPKSKGPRMWTLYVMVLALAFLVLGMWYWYKRSWTQAPDPTSSATEVSSRSAEGTEKEINELIAEVGKLILLPTDEVPTVATVSDPSKLVDQSFFKNAKVGDRVLIYTKSSKAYLYDPVARRLVEVAPITTEAQ